jgi:ketosteroid isomerase-like protein
MTALEDFLADLLPRIHTAEAAIHSGDAKPRFEMWSHTDPVTVLGAKWNAIGWREVEPMFERLAAGFSECTSCAWEVIAAEVGADMAYIAAIERTTAAVGNQPPTSYALRSTTILRREGNEWKIVHRHGSPYDDRAAPLLTHFDDASGDAPTSSNT